MPSKETSSSFRRRVWEQTRETLPPALAGAGTRLAVDAGLTYLGAATFPATAVAVGIGSAVRKGIVEGRRRRKSTKGFYNYQVTRHEKAHEQPWNEGWIGKRLVRGVKRLADNVAHGTEMRITQKAFDVRMNKFMVEYAAEHTTSLKEDIPVSCRELAMNELRNEIAQLDPQISRASGKAKHELLLEKHEPIDSRTKDLIGEQAEKVKAFFLRVARTGAGPEASEEVVSQYATEMVKEKLINFSMAHLTAGRNQEVKNRANDLYMAYYRAAEDLVGGEEEMRSIRDEIWQAIKKERASAGKKAVRRIAAVQLAKGPVKFYAGGFLARKIVQGAQWAKETWGISAPQVPEPVHDAAQKVVKKVKQVWNWVRGKGNQHHELPPPSDPRNVQPGGLESASSPLADGARPGAGGLVRGTENQPVVMAINVPQGGTLSGALADAGVISPDFTQAGSGEEFLKAVQDYCVGCGKLTPEQLQELQTAIRKDPNISLGQLWHEYPGPFTGLNHVDPGEEIVTHVSHRGPSVAYPLLEHPAVNPPDPAHIPAQEAPILYKYVEVNEHGQKVFKLVPVNSADQPAEAAHQMATETLPQPLQTMANNAPARVPTMNSTANLTTTEPEVKYRYVKVRVHGQEEFVLQPVSHDPSLPESADNAPTQVVDQSTQARTETVLPAHNRQPVRVEHPRPENLTRQLIHGAPERHSEALVQVDFNRPGANGGIKFSSNLPELSPPAGVSMKYRPIAFGHFDVFNGTNYDALNNPAQDGITVYGNTQLTGLPGERVGLLTCADLGKSRTVLEFVSESTVDPLTQVDANPTVLVSHADGWYHQNKPNEKEWWYALFEIFRRAAKNAYEATGSTYGQWVDLDSGIKVYLTNQEGNVLVYTARRAFVFENDNIDDVDINDVMEMLKN